MVRCGPAKVYTCRIMRPRTYFVNALRAAEGDTKSSGFTKRAASVNQAFAKKLYQTHLSCAVIPTAAMSSAVIRRTAGFTPVTVKIFGFTETSTF